MRFNRGLAGVGAQALARAANALISDESSGGGEKPGEAEGEGTELEQAGDGEGEEQTPGEGEGEEQTPGEGEGAGEGEGEGESGAQASTDLTQRDRDMKAAGRKEMCDRIDAVFAHENCAGREAAAAELLAADLPADRITKALGKLPKGSAGVDMLNRLANEAGGAPKLEPGSGDDETGSARAASAVWDRVGQKLGFNK